MDTFVAKEMKKCQLQGFSSIEETLNCLELAAGAANNGRNSLEKLGNNKLFWCLEVDYLVFCLKLGDHLPKLPKTQSYFAT